MQGVPLCHSHGLRYETCHSELWNMVTLPSAGSFEIINENANENGRVATELSTWAQFSSQAYTMKLSLLSPTPMKTWFGNLRYLVTCRDSDLFHKPRDSQNGDSETFA